MRRALRLAVIVSAVAVSVPATASYTDLPAFFAESWAIVDAAPLLRIVPSSGKSARLPIKPEPALASVQRGLPLADLVATPQQPPNDTGNDPIPAVESASIPAGDPATEPPRPVLRPQLMAYASLAGSPIGTDALDAIPFPIERPGDIPLLERTAPAEAKESVEPAPTKVAMLGGPTAGLAIGNLVKMAATDPIGVGGLPRRETVQGDGGRRRRNGPETRRHPERAHGKATRALVTGRRQGSRKAFRSGDRDRDGGRVL